jgi:hypothetical protein
MLTLLALAETTVALTLSLPADLPARPDFAARTRELSAALPLHRDARGTWLASARVTAFGMGVDAIITELDGGEVDPMPYADTRIGNVATKLVLAGALATLRWALPHRWQRAFDFVFHGLIGSMTLEVVLPRVSPLSVPWGPRAFLAGVGRSESRDARARREALADEYDTDAFRTCSFNQAHQRPGHASCGMR